MKITFKCDPALADMLPKPVPAAQALPSWLRKMPARAASGMNPKQLRTVKLCPPFVDAMAHGFTIPLPCEIHVKDGVFSWDWDAPMPTLMSHPRAPLSFHEPQQVGGTPLDRFGQTIIKFNSFWIIELSPGWSLFATHPVNRDDLPFRLIAGMVDSDRFNQVGINFPAVWVEPDYSGVLEKGTPVAQCFPVPREPLELVFDSLSGEAQRHYEEVAGALLAGPGVYRKRFRDRSIRSRR